MIWIEYGVIAVCVLTAAVYLAGVIRRSWSQSSCRSCTHSEKESNHRGGIRRKQLVQIGGAQHCAGDNKP